MCLQDISRSSCIYLEGTLLKPNMVTPGMYTLDVYMYIYICIYTDKKKTRNSLCERFAFYQCLVYKM